MVIKSFFPFPETHMTRFQKIFFVLGVAAFSFLVPFMFDTDVYSIHYYRIIVRDVVLLFPVFVLCCWLFTSGLPSISGHLILPVRPEVRYPWTGFAALSIFYFAVIFLWQFRSSDTMLQWEQVLLFRINDWNPAAHTFLLWLVTRVCPRYWFFLLVQAAFYAFLTGYFWKVLQCHCRIRPVWAFLTVMIAALSPVIIFHLCVAWKDTAMMVFCFAAALLLIPLATTNGAWLKSFPHAFLLGITLAAGTLMRHNALFFTVPLVLFLPFLADRKYWRNCLYVCLVFFSVFISAKFILVPLCCDTLQIEFVLDGRKRIVPFNQNFFGVTGLPLAVMGHIYQIADHRNLPPEFVDFMQSLAPDDVWEKYYRAGYGIDDVVNQNRAQIYGIFSVIAPQDFVRLFWGAVKQHPFVSVKAAFLNAYWAWKPQRWPGTYVYFLFLIALASFPYIKWKVIPFLFPVLSYQVGTSLLVMARDYRYFLYVAAVTLPFVWTMLFLVFRELHPEKVPDGQTEPPDSSD